MRAHEGWDREGFRQLLTSIQDQTGLTDADLANMAGRSRSQVNRWRVRAEHRPDYEPVAALARELMSRYPQVRPLAQKLLVATGYSPPAVEAAPAAPDEMPAGFDPSALPPAEVYLFHTPDTPLHVRDILVHTYRVLMDQARRSSAEAAAHDGNGRTA